MRPVADDSVSFTMAEDGTLLIEEAALLGSSSDPEVMTFML